MSIGENTVILLVSILGFIVLCDLVRRNKEEGHRRKELEKSLEEVENSIHSCRCQIRRLPKRPTRRNMRGKKSIGSLYSEMIELSKRKAVILRELGKHSEAESAEEWEKMWRKKHAEISGTEASGSSVEVLGEKK